MEDFNKKQETLLEFNILALESSLIQLIDESFEDTNCTNVITTDREMCSTPDSGLETLSTTSSVDNLEQFDMEPVQTMLDPLDSPAAVTCYAEVASLPAAVNPSLYHRLTWTQLEQEVNRSIQRELTRQTTKSYRTQKDNNLLSILKGIARRNGKLFCPFCFNRFEMFDVFISHELKLWDGTVVCPELQKIRCKHCNAKGSNAHTAKHCPNRGRDHF